MSIVIECEKKSYTNEIRELVNHEEIKNRSENSNFLPHLLSALENYYFEVWEQKLSASKNDIIEFEYCVSFLEIGDTFKLPSPQLNYLYLLLVDILERRLLLQSSRTKVRTTYRTFQTNWEKEKLELLYNKLLGHFISVDTLIDDFVYAFSNKPVIELKRKIVWNSLHGDKLSTKAFLEMLKTVCPDDYVKGFFKEKASNVFTLASGKNITFGGQKAAKSRRQTTKSNNPIRISKHQRDLELMIDLLSSI